MIHQTQKLYIYEEFPRRRQRLVNIYNFYDTCSLLLRVDDLFTVEENIVLGSEPTKAGVLDKKKAFEDIMAVSDRYGFKVDPKALVGDVSVGMQQRVEILKTLYRGAEILIFDEPTAVLTPQEIDELIEIMHGLVEEGKSIVLITHKLDEIKAVADRCTVIRRGKSIDTVNVTDVTQQELADLMVGRSVSFKTPKGPSNPTTPVLKITDLVVKENRGLDAVKGLFFFMQHNRLIADYPKDKLFFVTIYNNCNKFNSATFTLSNSIKDQIVATATADKAEASSPVN